MLILLIRSGNEDEGISILLILKPPFVYNKKVGMLGM